MRNKIITLFLAGLTLFGTSCTDGFEDMNKDPNKVTSVDPGYLMTRMWMRYNGTPHEEHRSNLIMSGPISGLFQSPYTTGQAFTGTNDGYNEAKMAEIYKDAVRNGVRLLSVLRADKSEDNTAKIAAATITLQFAFQRVTDLYGDIPYHEAGLGYEQSNFYPKYDSQEDIYKSSVDSLKKYRDILLTTTAAPYLPTGDVIYGGVAENQRNAAWARLANSLILRMGMRASSADANWAKATVEEAANNSAGFIQTTNTGEAAVLPTGSIGGDWGMIVSGSGVVINVATNYVYVGEEWLRMAQQSRDPRIFYVATQMEGNTPWTSQPHFDAFMEAARPGQPWKPVTFSPFKGGSTHVASRGLFVLRDGSTDTQFNTQLVISSTSGFGADYNEYFSPVFVNPQTIGNREAPIVVFGGDESYFILAEAAQRGWNVPGTAASNLKNALQLALAKYPKLYKMGSSVPDTYLAKQSAQEGTTLTYDGLAQEYITRVTAEPMNLELIWRERWKSLMTAQGGYEAFALWNRTNLAVTPVGRSYPGTENQQLPLYDKSTFYGADGKPNLSALTFGKEVAPIGYSTQLFHNGGNTEGWRPRRINYPNNEHANNGANVEAAMKHQIDSYGQVGSGSHFISTYMWISKKAN